MGFGERSSGRLKIEKNAERRGRSYAWSGEMEGGRLLRRRESAAQ